MIKVLISFILFTCCCCFINIPKINSKCYKEQENGYTVSGEFNRNENDLNKKSLFYCWGGKQHNLIFPIVFTGNSSVSIKPTSYIVYYERFTFEENVVVQFNKYRYNIMNYSVFKKNSFAVLNSHFEICSNIQIIGKRELNKPLILCFNCEVIKLCKKELGGCKFINWMNITYDYDNCVDIISLRSNLDSIND